MMVVRLSYLLSTGSDGEGRRVLSLAVVLMSEMWHNT